MRQPYINITENTGEYAMNIVPTKKQLDFLEWEMGVFFHFGIRTYYEGRRDFDGKPMPLEGFNPEKLDCRQWMSVIKEGGAKYAVLTCKHHDGFANWPSAYTEYSVKNTPWKNGKGDVVKEFTDACREYGIKTGLYYSPAQVGTKMENPEEYDEYFINQITELLTNYGKIDYLWFDGCGSANHKYDEDRIVKVIRSLQPEIMLFNMWDPDVLWVGNEEGIVPFGQSNVTSDYELAIDSGGAESIGEKRFFPYECDCRIRREKWFYSDSDLHLLRSLRDMEALYDYSVGRGANLLINIAPDRRGLLPEEDSKLYVEFGRRIKEKFANPVPCKMKREGNKFILTPEEPCSINCVVIKEKLENGEKITGFRISAVYYSGKEVALYEGKAVGHKQICRIPEAFFNSADESRWLYGRDIMVEFFGEDIEVEDIRIYYQAQE